MLNVRSMFSRLFSITRGGSVWWRLGVAVLLALPCWASPSPVVTISAPGEVLIGEDFHLRLSFANQGTMAGYGPYVDLYMPQRGIDGPVAGPCDGITFVAVEPTAPLAAPVKRLAAPHCVASGPGRTHPLTGAPVAAAYDDYQLVVLELTFANFEPVGFEPPVVVDVTAHVSDHADVRSELDPEDCEADGKHLELKARGGFRWGADAEDNAGSDPPVTGPEATVQVTPRVLTLGYEDPLSASPGSCFDGVDNGGDELTDFDDPDCGHKTYLGPENETATGASFHQRYQIAVDVAAGQQVTDLEVADVLPPAMQYVGVVSVQVRRPPPPTWPLQPAVPGATCAPGVDYVLAPPIASGPGGTLSLTFCSLLGTPKPDDVVIVFEFFVPQVDAAGQPVLDPATCEPAELGDDVRAQADWIPLDPRDRSATTAGDLCVESDLAPVDHVLQAKCVAIQKSVELVHDSGGAGATPGDRLRYTLAVQVSDYFQVGDLEITDVLSDGQSLVQPPAPHLLVNFDFSVPGTLSIDAGTPGCGETTLTFDLSQQLVDSALDADGVVQGWSGGITFEAAIDSDFQCPPPAGDVSVDKHDPLRNRVELHGNTYNSPTAPPTGVVAADGSGTETVIVSRRPQKSVYAVWRHGAGQPKIPPASLDLAAGDAVTYRIRYELPSCDAEALDVRDFLPRPLLDVDGPVLGSNGWDWGDTFDCGDPPAFPAPLSGYAQYGPDHTAPKAGPGSACSGLAVGQPPSNVLDFPLGTVHGDDDEPCVVDLLYTLEVTCEPFADGLFLNNRAFECEGNSFVHSPRVCQEATAQVRYVAPDLRLSKGVVAACCVPESVGLPDKDPITINLRRRPVPLACGGSTGTFSPLPVGPVPFAAPGGPCPRFSSSITSAGLAAAPIGSDLPSGLDPGELVTFALVVENVGHDPDGAFDVAIEDLLPAGFEKPNTGAQGINLCVSDGTGAPMPYDAQLNGNALSLHLTEPGASNDPPGSLDPPSAPPGRNLAVVTYDLKLSEDVSVGSCVDNQARISHYRSEACDHNLAEAGFGGPRSAAAEICRKPVPSKSIVATSESHTAGAALTIGEIVRYRLLVELPEGSTDFLRLVDELPPGLQLLDAAPSPRQAPPGLALGVVADQAPSLPPVLAGAYLGKTLAPGPLVSPPALTLPDPLPDPQQPDLFTVTGDPLAGGQTVTLYLGSAGIQDRDCDDELLVVELNALVLNAAINQAGETRTNRFHVEIGKKGSFQTIDAPPQTIRLVEPRLDLTKKVLSVTHPGQPGSLVTFSLAFTNTGTATAFDVRLVDLLPKCLRLVPGSAQMKQSGGASGAVLLASGKMVRIFGATVPVGGSVEVVFTATVTCREAACEEVSNDAFVIWSSLPGTGTYPNPTGSHTPGASGAKDGERFGAGGVNHYRDEAAATLPGWCPPDLTVDKTMSDGFLAGGTQRWQYTLTVTNLGPGDTQGPLTLADDLPPGFHFVSGGGNGWSCNEAPPGKVTCQHAGSPPLAAGDSVDVVVVVERPSGALGWGVDPLVNCATVTTPQEVRTDNNRDCLGQPCPNPDDPESGYWSPFKATCDGLWVCDPAVCQDLDPAACDSLPEDSVFFWSPCGCGCKPPPDLAIEKELTPPGTAPGTTTITVTNEGFASTRAPVQVTDTLPPGATFSGFSGDAGWSCQAGPPDPAGQPVTCTHPGPLHPGDELHLVLTLGGAVGHGAQNCATVESDSEKHLGNNRVCSCPDPDDPWVHYLQPQPGVDFTGGWLYLNLSCPPGQVPFDSPCGSGCIGDDDPCTGSPLTPTPFTGPATSLDGLLAMPPVLVPGETVVLRPLDPARTPPEGTWTFGGETVRQSFPWIDCPLPSPLIWQVPTDWSPGATFGVSYTDPRGNPVVAVEEVPDVEVIAAEPAETAEYVRPQLSGGSEQVAGGSVGCACGTFPTPETYNALLLDGEPLGSPMSASRRSLRVRLPVGLAPGPHSVVGRRSAGFPSGEAWRFEVPAVQASLDRRELLRGGSTVLSLTVVGTESPLSLRVSNHTPQIVSLEGGDEQVVTTPGGAENTVSLGVRALQRGDFDLRWELLLPECPCGPASQTDEPRTDGPRDGIRRDDVPGDRVPGDRVPPQRLPLGRGEG